MPHGFGDRRVTATPLFVRWIARDVARVRATLAATFGIEMSPVPIAIHGLRIEIAEGLPGPGDRALDRLEVVVGEPRSAISAAHYPTATGARFVALGWATVDVDRVVAAWAGAGWADVPRDSLVGARAVLGRPARTGADGTRTAGAPAGLAVTTLLLEPDTEGRLAASLARHGEGPTVLYVGLPAAAIASARSRLARIGVQVAAGSGPFGPETAITGRPASSPTLIIVLARRPHAAGSPAGDGRGTIRP